MRAFQIVPIIVIALALPAERSLCDAARHWDDPVAFEYSIPARVKNGGSRAVFSRSKGRTRSCGGWARERPLFVIASLIARLISAR
jgi:hypothetical protein